MDTDGGACLRNAGHAGGHAWRGVTARALDSCDVLWAGPAQGAPAAVASEDLQEALAPLAQAHRELEARILRLAEKVHRAVSAQQAPPTGEANCTAVLHMGSDRFPCLRSHGHVGPHCDNQGDTWEIRDRPRP